MEKCHKGKNPDEKIERVFKVISFDLAPLHLAVRGEKISSTKVKPLIYELISFESKKIDRTFLERLCSYLDTIDFSVYDLVLIEGQMAYMGFRKGMSPGNSKIQHFFEAYFLIKYPKLATEIVSASSKYPDFLRGKKATDYQRKKWGVERVRKLFEFREDLKSLEILDDAQTRKKADDLADTVLLIFAFFRKKNPTNYLFEDIFKI